MAMSQLMIKSVEAPHTDPSTMAITGARKALMVLSKTITGSSAGNGSLSDLGNSITS